MKTQTNTESAQQGSAHTPGPWTAGGFRGERCAISADGWNSLAEVYGNDDCPDLASQGRANTRLIAATPELLEALRAVLAFAEAPASLSADHDAVLSLVRAAIARAEGRT